MQRSHTPQGTLITFLINDAECNSFCFSLFRIIFVHYILHHILLARDDPESIEICYADIDCLAPEGYLTSTIMNFYIRFVYLECCNNLDYTWIIPMAGVYPFLPVSFPVLYCVSSFNLCYCSSIKSLIVEWEQWTLFIFLLWWFPFNELGLWHLFKICVSVFLTYFACTLAFNVFCHISYVAFPLFYIFIYLFMIYFYFYN